MAEGPADYASSHSGSDWANEAPEKQIQESKPTTEFDNRDKVKSQNVQNENIQQEVEQDDWFSSSDNQVSHQQNDRQKRTQNHGNKTNASFHTSGQGYQRNRETDTNSFQSNISYDKKQKDWSGDNQNDNWGSNQWQQNGDHNNSRQNNYRQRNENSNNRREFDKNTRNYDQKESGRNQSTFSNNNTNKDDWLDENSATTSENTHNIKSNFWGTSKNMSPKKNSNQNDGSDDCWLDENDSKSNQNFNSNRQREWETDRNSDKRTNYHQKTVHKDSNKFSNDRDNEGFNNSYGNKNDQISDSYTPSTSNPYTGYSKNSESSARKQDLVDVAPSSIEISHLNKLLHSTLASDVNITSRLEVVQSDPNKPLYSIKKFEDLNLKPELLKAIKYMNYLRPSKIQEMTLPALIAGQDTISQSQSGTGKTASFVLASLSRIDTSQQDQGVQCLVLAPTYELAIQIADVYKKLSQFMENISIYTSVRGEFFDENALANSQIVIGTVGTTLNWMKRGRFGDLGSLRMFVIDEADVMLDSDQDSSFGINDIANRVPKAAQKLFFSATYTDQVMDLATNVVPNALVIRLEQNEEAIDSIQNFYHICNDDNDKYNALCQIYCSMTIGQSIIFCKTRLQASSICERLMNDGHAVAMLTGALTIEQRASVMNRFRTGKERVLITTNVTARGIDISSVNLVVNYDLPKFYQSRSSVKSNVDFETYLHRVGRTGRFGKKGIAVNLITKYDLPLLESIERRFAIKIEKLPGH